MPSLKSFPRLWINEESIANFSKPNKSKVLNTCRKLLEADGKEYLKGTTFDYRESSHNSLLIRARIMQKRLVTLSVLWLESKEASYKKSILKHIKAMGDWEYWSWITWRKNDADPKAIFDLSYGENSATIAMVFDLLHNDLSEKEKKLFIEIAIERSFEPFLKFTTGKKYNAWWYKYGASNWNTVCAGGAGMLALVMLDYCKEAKVVLKHAELSIVPFFELLKTNGGGWDEGIGYWGYGMSYGFRYLISWENTFGKKHPIMEMPTTKKTVEFPLDFCPNGVPASFGDVNMFSVRGFHYLLATRFNRNDIVSRLDEIFDQYKEKDLNNFDWPQLAEFLLFHPGKSKGFKIKTGGVQIKYKKMDWCVLADQMPSPNYYVSIRGGSTTTSHSHMDLLSFQYVQGKIALIQNASNKLYLDTTFGKRRHELFEICPPAKNILMVNGVGIERPSEVTVKPVKIKGCPGYQIDGAKAMGGMRDSDVAQKYVRTFLLLENKYILIVDKIKLTQWGLVETRLHSPHKVSLSKNQYLIKGGKESCKVISVSSSDVVYKLDDDSLTDPNDHSKCLRMTTKELVNEALMATLIVPATKKAIKATLKISANHKKIEVIIGKKLVFNF